MIRSIGNIVMSRSGWNDSHTEKSEGDGEFQVVKTKSKSRPASLYSNSSGSAVSVGEGPSKLDEGWDELSGSQESLKKYPSAENNSTSERMLRLSLGLEGEKNTSKALAGSRRTSDAFVDVHAEQTALDKELQDFVELPELPDAQKYKSIRKADIPDQETKTQFKSEVELLNAMFSNRPERVSLQGLQKAFSDTFGKGHLSNTIEAVFSSKLASYMPGAGSADISGNPLGQFFSEVGTSKKTGMHKVHDFFTQMQAGRVALQNDDIKNAMPLIDKTIKEFIDEGAKPEFIKKLIKRRSEIISRPLVRQPLKSGSAVESNLRKLLMGLPDEKDRDQARILIDKIREGDRVQVALIGYPGTGKTTFWEELFKTLGVPYEKIERPKSMRDLLAPQSYYYEEDDLCPALIDPDKSLGQVVSKFAAAAWKLPPGGMLLIDEGISAFNGEPDVANTAFDLSRSKIHMLGFDIPFDISLATTGNEGFTHGGLRDRINEIFKSPPAADSRFRAFKTALDKALATQDKAIVKGKFAFNDRYSPAFKAQTQEVFESMKASIMRLDFDSGPDGVRFLQQVGKELPNMVKLFSKTPDQLDMRITRHISENILPSYQKLDGGKRLFGASSKKDRSDED